MAYSHDRCRHARAPRYDRGFSIVELVISTLIVAVLAAVAVPAYLQALERAEEKEATTILYLIYHAQKMYFYDSKDRAMMDPLNPAGYTNDLVLLQGYEAIPDMDNHWQYAIDSATDTTFEATATATDLSPFNRNVRINEHGAITYF